MADATKSVLPLALHVISAPKPWQAYRIPVSTFPLPEHDIPAMRAFVHALTREALQKWNLSLETFIQLSQLHYRDGAQLLSKYGREWIPLIGLGIWPDRDPPTLWTPDDFFNLREGESPRLFIHPVFRITTTPDARESAFKVMFGLGTIVQMLICIHSSEFLNRAKKTLLEPIQQESFRCYPFYVPLLSAESLRATNADRLSEWISGAEIYVRESPEDKGILIISSQPLDLLLAKLKARFVDGPEPTWQIPIKSRAS